MTDKDKQDIAELLANVLDQHPAACPNGIDAETAQTLKAFADSVRSGKKAAVKAFITLAIGALFAALFAGIKEIFNR